MTGTLIATLFSLDLVGILDPFSLLYRSFVVGFMPALNHSVSSLISLIYRFNLSSLGDTLVQFFEILDINTVFIQGLFIGSLFLGLLLLNMTRERFWCRYFCPLGALLGLFSRWNLLKLRIDEKAVFNASFARSNVRPRPIPIPMRTGNDLSVTTVSPALPFARPQPLDSVRVLRLKIKNSSTWTAAN